MTTFFLVFYIIWQDYNFVFLLFCDQSIKQPCGEYIFRVILVGAQPYKESDVFEKSHDMFYTIPILKDQKGKQNFHLKSRKKTQRSQNIDFTSNTPQGNLSRKNLCKKVCCQQIYKLALFLKHDKISTLYFLLIKTALLNWAEVNNSVRSSRLNPTWRRAGKGEVIWL